MLFFSLKMVVLSIVLSVLSFFIFPIFIAAVKLLLFVVVLMLDKLKPDCFKIIHKIFF